jgi:SNF2 family DNA or RNA helicase
VEVCGDDSDEQKEEAFTGFIDGKFRVLVSKPSIAGLGLNLQHCAHETFFPSHSYEQYYQAVRRCYRFGQKQPVTVDMIATDGQADVLKNLERKTRAADDMFTQLVGMMYKELKIERTNEYTKKGLVPSWM